MIADDRDLTGIVLVASNSLGFPKPGGLRPETRLAGYKRKRAITSNIWNRELHYRNSLRVFKFKFSM